MIEEKFRVGLALLAGMSMLQAQDRFANVEIKATHIAGNVHMLEGSGGNIGVSAGVDGLLIIDDQFAPLAGKIQAALRKIDKGKLEFVLNTHHHGDHTGGNAIFGKDARIVAHENVRRRLASSPQEALPTITYEQGMSLHFNGEELELMHWGPGHTDGDTMIYFKESNVLHMGDQFFNNRFPYIDLSSGGSVRGFLETVDTVIREFPGNVKIIPGHGEPATMDDLKRFREMLMETTGIVREQIAEGKSPEEVKEHGLPQKWDSWGKNFISSSRWIQIVYNSYTDDGL